MYHIYIYIVHLYNHHDHNKWLSDIFNITVDYKMNSTKKLSQDISLYFIFFSLSQIVSRYVSKYTLTTRTIVINFCQVRPRFYYLFVSSLFFSSSSSVSSSSMDRSDPSSSFLSIVFSSSDWFNRSLSSFLFTFSGLFLFSFWLLKS